MVGSPCCPRDSQESCPTPQLKASILQCSAFFTVQLSHPYMTTGKTIALTRQTFVGKVMSLFFNMLSRLVITFLPRSKCLNFMAEITMNLCMKCSLGISNFLVETSSLSHSVVFLYFFPLITEEGFLISPCYSLELCIQMGISFFFPLLFTFLLFTAICKPSLDSHFAFSHFFSMGMVLIPVSCTMSQIITDSYRCMAEITTIL